MYNIMPLCGFDPKVSTNERGDPRVLCTLSLQSLVIIHQAIL